MALRRLLLNPDRECAATMIPAPELDNESARLAALSRYGIVDTPSDSVLDGITQAAADLCETPIALISLIDPERQWLKSCVGLAVRETSRDIAFCAHAIADPSELMEVEDAMDDERFCDNPLVTGEPEIRFYAGKPLVTDDGYALGTLCVIDSKPRKLTPAQRKVLTRLAQTVIDLFQERHYSTVAAIDRLVMQAVKHAVLVTDPGRAGNPITYVTQAFETITGYSKKEVTGRDWFFLFGPETDASSVNQLKEAIDKKTTCVVTIKIYRKDRTEFWSEITLSPVKDKAGNTGNFVCVMQDVSDRYLPVERSEELNAALRDAEVNRASKNRLAELVEVASSEIYVADATSFQILNANRAARNNLGYSIEESENLMPWDFVVDLSQDRVRQLIEPLLSGELEAQVFEAMHVRKDGSTYPVEVRLQYMSSQTPPVFAAICQDISARNAATENVRLRERAIEALDVGVSITDATRKEFPFVYVNQALCKMTGYSRDELIGESVRILQKHDPQQPEHSIIQSAQAKCEPVKVVIDSTRKDGTKFKDEITLSPVHNTSGLLTHYIGINQDITERLNTQNRLQQTQKIEAVGQLSGGVAHDFNNLLSVITANLEFLTLQGMSDEQLELITEAEQAAKMGARLTRRLLTFARQSPVRPQEVDANDRIRTALSLLHSTIGKNITIAAELDNDLWNISADPSEIENTVVNLAINARDAMPDGGVFKIATQNQSLSRARAQSLGIEAGQYVQLKVSDTGCGMTEEVRARVFEPFFTTKEAGQGTGLGLSSIYGFIRQSGGSIDIESAPEQGTVITLYLPRYKATLSDAPDTHSDGEKPRSIGRSILVVEDHEMVRKAVVKRLGLLGHDTQHACNGPEAIKLLNTGAQFDLVFTDIAMDGGMSGYDVARWVKTNRPGCKVILTSGYNEQVADASDDEFAKLKLLTKPYSVAELQSALAEAFSVVTADAVMDEEETL